MNIWTDSTIEEVPQKKYITVYIEMNFPSCRELLLTGFNILQ